MIATYISATQFRVDGDLTAEFLSGRRIKADCGGDGYKYYTVTSRSYSNPYTTVTIAEGELTSNLIDVLYGIVNVGAEGSFPKHTHDSSEGQGGVISFDDLADNDIDFLQLIDTPPLYESNKVLETTGSGIVFSDKLDNFLQLADTPTTYSGTDGRIMVSTGSGIEFYTEYDKDFIKAGLSADQSINDSAVKLTINTAIDGNSDLLSNNSLVAPRDGRYNITYQVSIRSGSECANLGELWVYIRVNSTTINFQRGATYANGGWNGRGTAVSIPNVLLNEGDVVDFYTGQYPHAARYIDSDPIKTWVYMETVESNYVGDTDLSDYVPWYFGDGTISGTGDIYCNDLHTASGTLYIGDLKLSSAGGNMLVDDELIAFSKDNMILTSPNGSKFKIKVDDSGNLSTEVV